jgi:hypothetical protein
VERDSRVRRVSKYNDKYIKKLFLFCNKIKMSRTVSYIPIEKEFLNNGNPPSRQQMKEYRGPRVFLKCLKKFEKCDKCCESCLLSQPNKELRYVLIDK